MDKKNKGNIFYRILDIITDILMIPIVVLSAVCTVIMFNARTNNQVPSIFGVSAVEVLSGSMLPTFKKGDIVVLERIEIKEIQVGDNIAFYWVEDSAVTGRLEKAHKDNEELKDFPLSSEEVLTAAGFKIYNGRNNPKVSSETTGTNKDAIRKSANQKAAVVFHKVMRIMFDEVTGHTYYETKGTNNNTVDRIGWLNQSYVVGRYEESLSWIGKVIHFCGSVEGIIFLVEVPCGILLLMLTLQLIQQIDEYLQNKSGKKRKYTFKKGWLKNLDRVKEKRLKIKKIITQKFSPWFDKYIYSTPGTTNNIEVRKVRQARLKIQKSMRINF